MFFPLQFRFISAVLSSKQSCCIQWCLHHSTIFHNTNKNTSPSIVSPDAVLPHERISCPRRPPRRPGEPASALPAPAPLPGPPHPGADEAEAHRRLTSALGEQLRGNAAEARQRE